MTCQSKFDDVEFHDGVINTVSVSILEQLCEIDLGLGDYKVGRGRSASLLSCKGLNSFFGRFGFLELADSASFGNIQDGRVDVSGGSLRLYLAGGLVEAAGSGVELDARRELVDPAVTSEIGVGSGGFTQIEEADFLFSHLESIHFSAATNACVIDLLMSAGGSTSDLYPVRMSFSRVTSCLAKLDVSELAGEHRFGNVRSCIVSRKEKMVRMYVRDGFIEVVAARASLVRR
ncbi:hypothetical protein [Stenotrophomonas sp. AB1(2024)]|uniref:hypothetical protein n=1 Tax=Stenotrophomonas sp. AB1(2024) TaxID=3132215 RepID=UPI003099FF73